MSPDRRRSIAELSIADLDPRAGLGRLFAAEIVDGHVEELVPRVAVVEHRGWIHVHQLQILGDPHGMAVLFEEAATIGLRVRPSRLDHLLRHRQTPWNTMGRSSRDTAEFAIGSAIGPSRRPFLTGSSKSSLSSCWR